MFNQFYDEKKSNRLFKQNVIFGNRIWAILNQYENNNPKYYHKNIL